MELFVTALKHDDREAPVIAWGFPSEIEKRSLRKMTRNTPALDQTRKKG
jgi:hypothetical protein